MPAKSSDRSSFFPLIEKKYGKPMSHWFALMKKNADKKYPEQISILRDGHAFSQAHANAVVMYCKGSTSSRRFDTMSDYLGKIDKTQAKTIKAIFAAIRKKYPKLEPVIAWNQPMLKLHLSYCRANAIRSHGLRLVSAWICRSGWPRWKKRLKASNCRPGCASSRRHSTR